MRLRHCGVRFKEAFTLRVVPVQGQYLQDPESECLLILYALEPGSQGRGDLPKQRQLEA